MHEPLELKLNLHSLDVLMHIKKQIPKALKTAVWLTYVGRKFEAKCYVSWCKTVITPFSFETGHNVPESKGGQTSLGNLRPICSQCNKSMGNRFTIDEFSKSFAVQNVANVKQGFLKKLGHCFNVSNSIHPQLSQMQMQAIQPVQPLQPLQPLQPVQPVQPVQPSYIDMNWREQDAVSNHTVMQEHAQELHINAILPYVHCENIDVHTQNSNNLQESVSSKAVKRRRVYMKSTTSS